MDEFFCVWLLFLRIALHCTISLPDIRMKVLFTDISKSGNRYAVTDDDWLVQTRLHKNAPVHSELTLNRKGDTRVEVRGFLHTGLELTCDRCLAAYNFAVKMDFHFILEVENEDSWHVKELECSKENIDIVHVEEPVVDFADILRQQVYLSLPIKQICSRNCKGLCSECGINKNSGECVCAHETKNSPFAVLASLKKG
ncbi:MAG: DUF177 domain-containing protein [Candidatus Electrothrix sp. AR4]|nr:DUF177 domain-containing protein [Candidatus Electrothrix sp. AR4]